MQIAIISGLAFLIVFSAIKPLKIKKFILNMAWASVLAVFLLFILKIIDFSTIYQGIIGNGQMEPWKIIVIFFSVAYISISTDITGIFDFLAYKIVHKTKGNGIKLFIFFYLFAGLLSIFTSNDIVILTLTPIIFYLSKHAKINVIPLLFAEFFAANTFSMFFYIDNPTNIMVVNALGIGFLEYAKIMFLPTIVASITTGLLLLAVFKNKITKTFVLRKSSAFKVRNWLDAVISLFLMLVMLTLLILSQEVHLPIWIITLAFAIIFIFEDLLFSLYYYVKSIGLTPIQLKKYSIPKDKNEFMLAFKRMPWSILPFILAFFIIVQALNDLGVISLLAKTISYYSSSLFSSISVMGIVGLFSANIINNQPMTILFSNVLVNNSFAVTQANLQASAYALIVSSNLSANITLIGALAGLMWKNILDIKGVSISYLDFLKKGIIITPIVFVITLATLWLVLL